MTRQARRRIDPGVVFALLVASAMSCSDPDRTRTTLEAHGFTAIVITGYSWTSCSKNDTYCTGFEAVGPSGRHVHGAVGCGHGCSKGCTLRLEP